MTDWDAPDAGSSSLERAYAGERATGGAEAWPEGEKPAGGPVGSRTERAHAKDGWFPSR